MFEHPATDAHYFSRTDPNELLGTCAFFSFELEGKLWPSVEHYIQAMQFSDEARQEAIRIAPNPRTAQKLGKTGWFKRARDNWKETRVAYMTRGVYTRCRTHGEIRAALLATGDTPLVENSQYDYFWGCGRDRRGDNMYGKVLMQVRDKLREEAQLEANA